MHFRLFSGIFSLKLAERSYKRVAQRSWTNFFAPWIRYALFQNDKITNSTETVSFCFFWTKPHIIFTLRKEILTKIELSDRSGAILKRMDVDNRMKLLYNQIKIESVYFIKNVRRNTYNIEKKLEYQQNLCSRIEENKLICWITIIYIFLTQKMKNIEKKNRH